MGETLAKAHADVESPSQPGHKSVITDPLDGCCDRESFWAESLALFKDPLLLNERPVLKAIEVTENRGQEDVTVRATLDGKKLKKLKIAETEDDPCILCQRHIFSKEKWEVWTSDLDPRDGTTVRYYTTTKLLEDPLRVECWLIGPDGTRASGADLAKVVQEAFLAPILLSVASCKVQVSSGVPAPDTGDLCVMTSSLEGHLPHANLARELVDTLKQMNRSLSMLISTFGGKGASEMQLEEISDSQFVMQQLVPKPGEIPKDGTPPSSVLRLMNFNLDGDKGLFKVETSLNGEHQETGYYQVYADPPRIAYWKEQQGRRMYGREAAGILRLIVKTMIDGHVGEGKDDMFFW